MHVEETRRGITMSARSDCVYLQPLKLGAGRDSWLIINISTTSTAGESNGGGGEGKRVAVHDGDEAV